MNPHLAWYTARSSGMVAWGLSVLSVLWGTALATRALGKRPNAPWLLDLHRFLGALTLAFVAVHLAGLVWDADVYFGWNELFVPLGSVWRPWPTTLGILAFYLLVVIELTSLLRRRLPKRLWHAVHLSSYLVAVLGTAHAVMAGHDAPNRLFLVSVLVSAGLVLFLVVYRLSVDDERPARTSSSAARAAAARASRTDAAAGGGGTDSAVNEGPAVEPRPTRRLPVEPIVPAAVVPPSTATGGGGGARPTLTETTARVVIPPADAVGPAPSEAPAGPDDRFDRDRRNPSTTNPVGRGAEYPASPDDYADLGSGPGPVPAAPPGWSFHSPGPGTGAGPGSMAAAAATARLRHVERRERITARARDLAAVRDRNHDGSESDEHGRRNPGGRAGGG